MGYEKIRRPIVTPVNTDSNVSGAGSPNFETGEYDTGRKWIDGKTIYAKVVSDIGGGNYTANSNNNIAHGLTLDNIDRITALSGLLKRDTANEYVPLPFGSSAGVNWCIDLAIRDTNVVIRPGSNWNSSGNRLSDGVFLVEYTKTA